jgi:hypothetical protein
LSTTFLVLYRGESVGSAKLLALTAEPDIVRDFANRLLSEPTSEEDAVVRELERGRQRALQLVKSEAE